MLISINNWTRVWLFKLGPVLACCVSLSCAESLTTTQSETGGLEATLPFTIEGKSYTGVATVPRKSNRKFEINFSNNISWGLISTCHRDLKLKQPRGKWVWYYIPAMFLENDDSCIMIHKQITDKGAEHFAIVNFTAGEDLPVDMYCNGVKTLESGASICQARAGTEQMLWFKESVQGFTDEACNPLYQRIGHQMRYAMPENFCAYLFKNAQGKIHRHVSYGYTHMDLQE